MSIGKIMYALNAYTKQLAEHKETFDMKTEDLQQKKTPEAIRNYEVALADRKMSDKISLTDFEGRYKSALAAMRRKNQNRTFEAPTDGMINILAALRMVDNPGEQVIASAAKSMGGNVLALLAVNSIAKKANCKEADIFMPMNEKDAAAALDALETYCNNVAKTSADKYLATAKEWNMNAADVFVNEVLHISATPFLMAVSD